jgi:hypothetical protein
LNAINASNLVITPVQQDLDSFNAAEFLKQKMTTEVSTSIPWFLTINGYNKVFEDAIGGNQKVYIELYQRGFPNLLTPKKTWFPWIGRASMNELKDKRLFLTKEKTGKAGRLCNEKLFDAVFSLVSCWTDEKLVAPQEF